MTRDSPSAIDGQRRRFGPRRGFAAIIAACAAAACSDDPAGPTVAVDLDALFAPATAAEIAAVEAEWAARDPGAVDVEERHRRTLFVAGAGEFELRVLGHGVDGARHHSVVLVPDAADGAGALPLLVYAHGGDNGLHLEELQLVLQGLGGEAADFVWVAPSFRGEGAFVAGQVFFNEAVASPWDRDVDDALASIDAALITTPEADGERIGVVGVSRGAGVALLMGVRDPRIGAIVGFFGPTDFFLPSVREIVDDALRGEPRNLPGLSTLDERFVQPLARGEIGIDDVRPELVRRSAVLWAARLPAVQVHHGTADPIVDFGHAVSLRAALVAAGREAPDAEVFTYPGGTHSPLTLPGSISRSRAFLVERLGSGVLASR